MPHPAKSPDLADRYWRTMRRKLGEDFDLAGKALAAAAVAALFAPLSSKGIIAFPSPRSAVFWRSALPSLSSASICRLRRNPMNDPINGLLAVAIAIFVFAVAATLFTGHQQRKYAALAEAEREAERQAAAQAGS